MHRVHFETGTLVQSFASFGEAMSVERTQYMELGELTRNATLACIDGRHTDCVVGAPGGNMGEFILLLTALERATMRLLRRPQIQEIFSEFVTHFGRFYMHTDQHALRWIASELELKNITASDVVQASERRSELLDLLTTPQGVGCGHLKGMLMAPSRYDVRRKLVEDALAAYFLTLWEYQDSTSLHYEELQGEHDESEVIIFEADDAESLPEETRIPMACKHESASRFVVHDAARRFLLVKAKEFIRDREQLTSEENERFRSEVNRLVSVQLEATRKSLFPTLPTRVIRITG